MSISLWAFTGFLSVVLIISLLEIIFWPVYFDCNEGKITCFVLALTFFIYISLFSKFSCFLTFPCSRKFKILRWCWLRYNSMWCKMKQIHINRNGSWVSSGKNTVHINRNGSWVSSWKDTVNYFTLAPCSPSYHCLLIHHDIGYAQHNVFPDSLFLHEDYLWLLLWIGWTQSF